MTTQTRGPGRPSALSEEVMQRFIAAIQGCNTIEDAALYAGVTNSTVHRWLQKGEKQPSGEFREFWERTQQAKAFAKMRLIKVVVDVGQVDHRVAMKILQVRHPEEWGKTARIKVEDTTPVERFQTSIRDQVAAQLDQIEKRLAAAHVTPVPADLAASGNGNGATHPTRMP